MRKKEIDNSKETIMETEELKTKLGQICKDLISMLLEKNRKYGNSALSPQRIFSKADSVEQIKVRIDDKLNRIKNEQADEDEDVYKDLMGYLLLLMIAKESNEKN